MSDEVQKQIGDYQILKELGSGGMGRVYLVRHVISDRVEAMKVLLPDLAGRQELAARFLREIKLMASLNHPNIAALRTAFANENQLVMIMEYVEGSTLAHLLERGPIAPQDALNYMDQVLSALGFAHDRHIIHRDIKPSNMMLTPQGVIKLMDFGIARADEDPRLTTSGITLGSLAYMSPEQAKGLPTDTRSDLYSVGISLYEMVTGRCPFQADSHYSMMAAHIKETPKPPIELLPSLPPALNEIILMAIAKDPACRFLGATAFRNALNNVRNAIPSSPAASAFEAATVETLVPQALRQNPGAAPTPISLPAAVIKDAQPASPAFTPPAARSAHRGLYMTLGALIVVAVLVVAGIYLPSRLHIMATAPPPTVADEPSNQTQVTQAPAPPGPSATPAPPATEESFAPAGNPNSEQPPVALAATREVEKPKPPQTNSTRKTAIALPKSFASQENPAASERAVVAPGEPAESSPQDASEAEGFDELERDLDQLVMRATAVDTNLERLKQEQAAAAFGLRGDMAARQMSMKNNLAKAQDAIQHNELARARKYTKLASGDVEALERFLGR